MGYIFYFAKRKERNKISKVYIFSFPQILGKDGLLGKLIHPNMTLDLEKCYHTFVT